MQPNRIHQHICLEEIIRNKNPRLLKFLPSGVLRYIKYVIHLDELNNFLASTQGDFDHDFVNSAIKNFKVDVTSTGLENIPKQGACIIVCNHPLGGLDGIAMLREVGKVRKDIKALVNDLIMKLKNLNGLLIPINKHGKNSIENIRLIDKTYASDECLIVFPAGLVSRKQGGKIKDLEWKKSFITKAIKYKQDIIPVYIEARNSNFFYNLALLRKKFGIRTNIEMFYLVDEAYKQKGKSINLVVGPTISYTGFTKNHSDSYWAEEVKKQVYNLKEGNN